MRFLRRWWRPRQVVQAIFTAYEDAKGVRSLVVRVRLSQRTTGDA